MLKSSFRSLDKPVKVNVLVSHEVTCPVCESYEIEEDRSCEYACLTCGVSWKIMRQAR